MGNQLHEGDFSISHLLYMDDINLFSITQKYLKKLIVYKKPSLMIPEWSSVWTNSGTTPLKKENGIRQMISNSSEHRKEVKHETYKYLAFLKA